MIISSITHKLDKVYFLHDHVMSGWLAAAARPWSWWTFLVFISVIMSNRLAQILSDTLITLRTRATRWRGGNHRWLAWFMWSLAYHFSFATSLLFCLNLNNMLAVGSSVSIVLWQQMSFIPICWMRGLLSFHSFGISMIQQVSFLFFFRCWSGTVPFRVL